MSLQRSARLGPYEIISAIGAGGMGEVYRARDSKLGREVALKVLPEALASDAQYMSRFQREAQVLASLNHPHIASIYGLEDSGGVRALVMELVEGPTLAERIKAGPLPQAEALELARQIAEALEYAHEKGVIHRDLKPANVKITSEGMVKVLDFGLAKASERKTESGQWEDSPTQPVSTTQPGMILGTAAYMAPEQVRGEAVDKRADIWAFGVVLLEMLTGKRTFRGDTTSDTLAAVLTKDPEWERLPAGTPASIRRLLKRCLERDRKKRLRDIGDARMEIEEYLASPGEALPPARRSLISWVVVSTALLVALAGLAVVHFREVPAESTYLKYSIPPPEKTSFMHLAPSPDGRLLAFTAINSASMWPLYLRRFDSFANQLLAPDGILPFWSPDSRFLGFWSGYKLKIIDVQAPSGPSSPQILCDAIGPGGATWSGDGVIVFGGGPGHALYRVSAAGGEAKALTSLDQSRQEKTHFWPSFLPDGNHFLYTVISAQRENSGIYVGSLDSRDRKRLLADLSNAVYIKEPTEGGRLLYVRNGTLMDQRFDAAKLQLAGEPRPLAQQVNYDPAWAQANYAPSGKVLTFLSNGKTQLTWFDRTGKRIGTVGEPAFYDAFWLRLSPDEKQVALARRDPDSGTFDIWLIELARGMFSRFTSDPADDVAPVWSPDGKRLVFSSNRKGYFDFYEKYANGGGKEELLLQAGRETTETDWSPDGRFLLYSGPYSGTLNDLWMLPLFGDRKPTPFLKTEFAELSAAFSPDGKWVAYSSSELDRFEIFVRPFPPAETGGKWRISNGGGGIVHWRRDGKELFFEAPGKIMAVPVTVGATFRPGVPRLLFEYNSPNGGEDFAVTADGQRFLMLTSIETGSAPVTVVVNWTQGLKP